MVQVATATSAGGTSEIRVPTSGTAGISRGRIHGMAASNRNASGASMRLQVGGGPPSSRAMALAMPATVVVASTATPAAPSGQAADLPVTTDGMTAQVTSSASIGGSSAKVNSAGSAVSA